jgi:hypothetical protein
LPPLLDLDHLPPLPCSHPCAPNANGRAPLGVNGCTTAAHVVLSPMPVTVVPVPASSSSVKTTADPNVGPSAATPSATRRDLATPPLEPLLNPPPPVPERFLAPPAG